VKDGAAGGGCGLSREREERGRVRVRHQKVRKIVWGKAREGASEGNEKGDEQEEGKLSSVARLEARALELSRTPAMGKRTMASSASLSVSLESA